MFMIMIYFLVLMLGKPNIMREVNSMEVVILIAAGIFTLVILYFQAKRLVNTVKGDPVKSSCNCCNCSNSCAIREIPNTADDPVQKQ